MIIIAVDKKPILQRRPGVGGTNKSLSPLRNFVPRIDGLIRCKMMPHYCCLHRKHTPFDSTVIAAVCGFSLRPLLSEGFLY